jgi:hypothetical protein
MLYLWQVSTLVESACEHSGSQLMIFNGCGHGALTSWSCWQYDQCPDGCGPWLASKSLTGPVQADRGPDNRAGGGPGVRACDLRLRGPVLDASTTPRFRLAPDRVERAGVGPPAGRVGRTTVAREEETRALCKAARPWPGNRMAAAWSRETRQAYEHEDPLRLTSRFDLPLRCARKIEAKGTTSGCQPLTSGQS